MKFLSPRPAIAKRANGAKGLGSRRWNRRPVRADVLVGRHLRKKFLTGGSINKGRRRGENGYAKRARRAALLIVIRLRRVLTAVVRGRVVLHLHATTRLGLRRRCSCGHRRQAERPGRRQAKEKSQGDSHRKKNRALPEPGQSRTSGAAVVAGGTNVSATISRFRRQAITCVMPGSLSQKPARTAFRLSCDPLQNGDGAATQNTTDFPRQNDVPSRKLMSLIQPIPGSENLEEKGKAKRPPIHATDSGSGQKPPGPAPPKAAHETSRFERRDAGSAKDSSSAWFFGSVIRGAAARFPRATRADCAKEKAFSSKAGCPRHRRGRLEDQAAQIGQSAHAEV